ncbi:MAG: hypothetical protein HRU15_02445 [Planctomycetes bacterium]|nr:hypothetical protein [Planctomycetota bacterium]
MLVLAKFVQVIGIFASILAGTYIHSSEDSEPNPLIKTLPNYGINITPSTLKLSSNGTKKYLTATITLSIPNGLHTYYRNPGNIGVGTHVQFTNCEIVQSHPWPLPKISHKRKQIAYVYNDQLTISYDIEINKGSTATDVTAIVSGIYCNDTICSPFEETLRCLAVENTDVAQTVSVTPTHTYTLRASINKKELLLRIEPKLEHGFSVYFFANSPDLIRPLPSHSLEIGTDASILRIATSQYLSIMPQRLHGLLSINDQTYAVNCPLVDKSQLGTGNE